MKTKLILGLLAIGLLFPTTSRGQSLPSGQSIADKTYARDEGISMRRNLTMELKDKRGKVRRARIFYFRGLTGKKARIKERRS